MPEVAVRFRRGSVPSFADAAGGDEVAAEPRRAADKPFDPHASRLPLRACLPRQLRHERGTIAHAIRPGDAR
jgi:hypothetical protein